MESDITDLNVLYDAFRASMKGSAWKEEPQRFEIDFLSEIVRLKKELSTRTYITSKGTEFTLNERGKTRFIHGARMRDRVVRHALCDNELTNALKPYLIHNNGASQKGKGITFARGMFEKDLHNYWLEHRTNRGYVGFVDISKFYDNIRHDEVRRMVCPKLSPDGAWLLSYILSTFEIDVSYMSEEEYARCLDDRFDSIRYHEEIPDEAKTGIRWMKKSVEIGDQISQDIGVFFPTRLDNYAKIVRGCKRYGRYMDDIYVITETKEELQSIIKGISEQAAALGMFVHERKTHIAKLSDTYKYLQVRYSLTETGRVIRRISPQAVTRERRRLKKYKRMLEDGRIQYKDSEDSFKSWVGGQQKYLSNQQVKNLLFLFYELYGRTPVWKKTNSRLRYLTEQSSQSLPSTATTTSQKQKSQ